MSRNKIGLEELAAVLSLFNTMPHTMSIAGPALAPFDHQPRTRLVFGANTVDRAGELARELGARRILVVTDAGIVAAGHAGHVRRSLEVAGLQVTLFDRVRENPTTRCVEDCVNVATAAGIDAIVGLGGGSSMDTAKGCNFLLTNGGRMQDYWGVGKAKKLMLPFIAIPTTAGTGSECQSAALIADEQTHQKMACLDPKCAARIAILDPTLTVSQPPRVTACTGIDAIAHAVETAVTVKRTPISAVYSREALKLMAQAFPRVLGHPADLDARGQMLLGAAFAGVAIENSMLGAAHAAANPLTAQCGIVHGQAVGFMLPLVVRFNAVEPAARDIYAEWVWVAGLGQGDSAPEGAVQVLVEWLGTILNLAGFPRSLEDCGVERSQIPELAEEAARQWTGTFNPRPVGVSDFARLYDSAFALAR